MKDDQRDDQWAQMMRHLEEALRREAVMRLSLDDERRMTAMLRAEIQELQLVIALRPRLTDEELRHIHDRDYLALLRRLADEEER